MGTVIVPVQWRHIILSCYIQHKNRILMLQSASGLPAPKENSLSTSTHLTSIIIAKQHFLNINPSLASKPLTISGCWFAFLWLSKVYNNKVILAHRSIFNNTLFEERYCVFCFWWHAHHVISAQINRVNSAMAYFNHDQYQDKQTKHAKINEAKGKQHSE